MNLQQFVDAHTGKFLDLDGAYGAQCMDLANAYAQEVLNAPRFGGNAVDVFSAYPTALYARVANSPTNIPQPGDVIIWGGPDPRVGTSQYGHIAVVVTAGVASFWSYDQNWPEQSPCHLQYHTYDAVLGWLNPHVLHPVPAAAPAGHPPVSAADAVDTLRRHSAALTDHPSVDETNKLLAAIKAWPSYRA